MAISINFTKTVDNAVDLSQKKTYIKGAFTSASDIANFPTVGIATGSELVNVGGGNDTGKKYVFTGTEWILAPSGGGGGSSNKFIVTLTPTALDFSGVMDKTVAEITTAYEAGQDIWFDVVAPNMGNIELKCTQVGFDSSGFPSFNAPVILDTNNMLVLMYTGTTDDGTKQTYFTSLYALTPVS